MKKIKKAILLFVILLMTIISIGCSKSTAKKIDNSVKEDVYIGGPLADFRRSYKNTKELSSESEIVFKGKARNIRSIIKNDNIISLVDIDIEDVYFGDKYLDKITLSIMGGVMDGDEFINSSIAKMFIEKGAKDEDLKKMYSGKNVRFDGFEGEKIPVIGESYIVFARNSVIDKDIFYIVGGGYDQGLFHVNDDDMVSEFDREARMNGGEIDFISINKFLQEFDE